MQKYRLSDFEFFIDPSTWNSAQDLIQAGAIRSLREVEKHFWVAAADTPGGALEVEVIITPHRIKAYTCECWSENRRLMCPHIAAVLLKIRQYLAQRQEERRKIREVRQEKALNRLTVPGVLEDVGHDDLLEFVKNYARRDRDFALALKTWFAGQVKGHQNPFFLILDSAIPPPPLRATDRRRLRKTLDDLLAQLETAAKDGHLHRTAQIAEAIIEKTAPLLAKEADRPESELPHYCLVALQTLRQAPWQAGSPELQEALWQTLCRWADSSWFPPALNAELIGVLFAHSDRPGHFEDVERMFDRAPAPVPDRLLQLYAAALAKKNRPEAVVRLLEHVTAPPAALPELVRLLQNLQLYEAALLAAEYLLEHRALGLPSKRELEDRALQLADKLSDRPRLLYRLRKRFLETGSAESFHRLKLAAAADWPEMLIQLLQELRERGDRRRLAALFAAEKEFDALESLLSDCADMELPGQYAGVLRDEFLYTRYKELLTTYLQDHFGKPAALYARQTLDALLKNGKHALASRIVRDLTESFPDRPSLPEELAELFPGPKKLLR